MPIDPMVQDESTDIEFTFNGKGHARPDVPRLAHMRLRSLASAVWTIRDAMLGRPSEQDFDAWLTRLPSKELQHLNRITYQALDDTAEDQAVITYVFPLIFRFCRKPELSTEEVNDLFHEFAFCLGLEILRRQGDVVKSGAYSMIPGEKGPLVTIIDKRKAEKGGQ